jgi:hypothetical protein
MKTKKLLCTMALLSPLCCLAETTSDTKPTNPETWIAFLPVIFYALILIVTTFKLRSSKTSLADLITEKDPSAVAAGGGAGNGVAPADNAAAGGAGNAGGAAGGNNAAGGATGGNPPQSVSRLIAFLTGLVALTIGICICTFYMYSYFSDPSAKIDFSNFTNVIWGLGIGVLPYGFNKASSALKQNS